MVRISKAGFDEAAATNLSEFRSMGDTVVSFKIKKSERASRAEGGISRMKSIVEAALFEDGGLDFGPLSHDERNKLLINR